MSSSTDCYLCGASNDLDAEFCIRCSGQLLRLPSDGPSTDVPEQDESTETEDSDQAEIEDSGRARRVFRRKNSVQDERLSDALGLSDNSHTTDPEFLEAVVTDIPRATPSADIPLIGTRPGAVTQKTLDGNSNQRTFVLLGLLLLATVWLGWTTLRSNSGVPDNLAFDVSTTTSTPSTTTTEPPRREWTTSEIESEFRDVFERAQLLVCGAIDPTARRIESPVLERGIGSGVAIDRFNSLIDTSELPNATVALLVSRQGISRIALLQPSEFGTLATARTATRRDLNLAEREIEESRFTVNYDPETNRVNTTEGSSGTSPSVSVNAFGDAEGIRVGDQQIPVQRLQGLGDMVVRVNENQPIDPDQSACTQAALHFELASAAEARELAAAQEPGPAAGEENEQTEQSNTDAEESSE